MAHFKSHRHFACVATLAAVLFSGCGADPLQPRIAGQPGTFGEGLFTLVCQRVSYSASLEAQQAEPSLPLDVSGARHRMACRYGAEFLPPLTEGPDRRVHALLAQREAFVNAIDRIFPEADLSDLQEYMVALLPLTDSGALPGLLQKLAEVIGEAEADPVFLHRLARLQARQGYRPEGVILGHLRELLNYPRFDDLLDAVLAAYSGPASERLINFADALGFELRGAQRVDDGNLANPRPVSDPERPVAQLIQLLLSEDARLGEGHAHWLVRRDFRGVAQVRAAGGSIPAPFVDKNQDGLADLAELGGLISQSGYVPTPFPTSAASQISRDDAGRALVNGAPLYEYINLDQTLLATLVRDLRATFDATSDPVFGLPLAFSTLLGERAQRTKVNAAGETLTYEGYAAEVSSAVQLTHALTQLLKAPTLNHVLVGARDWLRDHPSDAARLIAAIRQTGDLSEPHAVTVQPGNTAFDQGLLVAQQILAVPGLASDLLSALTRPETARLWPMLANLMTYRDVHQLNPAATSVANPTFAQKVDRNLPDSGHSRSIWQRLLHTLHDANGVKMCNRAGAILKVPALGIPIAGPFAACQLIEVDNAALLYVRSIARQRTPSGTLTSIPKAHIRLKLENMAPWLASIVQSVGTDTVLDLMSGISGFGEHPTPQALNRLLYMETLPPALADVMDPIRDRDGELFHQVHQGSVLSWEVPQPGFSCATGPCTFYDAVRPIVQVFADHNAEQLLVDLLVVLHKHWSSASSSSHQFNDANGANFSYGSNLVSAEPVAASVLADGDLLPALTQLAGRLKSQQIANGPLWSDALIDLLRFVIDPAQTPGLTKLGGSSQALFNDGVTPAPGGLSVAYLFRDALRSIDDALDQATNAGRGEWADLWAQATDRLGSALFPTTGIGTSARFGKAHTAVVLEKLIGFAAGRVQRHVDLADSAAWAEAIVKDVQVALASPVVPALVDLLDTLHDQGALRLLTYDLLNYLMGDGLEGQAFSSTLTSFADLLQMARDDDSWVPILRFAGRALSKETGMIDRLWVFLRPAMAAPGREALLKVLRASVSEQQPGRSPLDALLSVAQQVQRVEPLSDAPLAQVDYKNIMATLRQFLDDHDRGLVAFTEVIKRRCGAFCSE